MLSQTEENYLKALFHLTSESPEKLDAGTNEISTHLAVKPATVNDMLKKLREKGLIHYEKYKKISLSDEGKTKALNIVRKHRLWETFLFEKLEFTWDEVHEIAEQLEHIQSDKLTNKLEKFLGYPQFDPHGDVIPTAYGELKVRFKESLADIAIGESCKIAAIKDNSVQFLNYVDEYGLQINSTLKVVSKNEFDAVIEFENGRVKSRVSEKFAANIIVICSSCKKGVLCPKAKCQVA